uniref:Uncharacterized protein n=1 Tax=Paramoeba aestuarina TaxID=180227 RepID=A0A7S4N5V7_9EUKA
MMGSRPSLLQILRNPKKNLDDRLKQFQKMCAYFVTKNDEISFEKQFTKLLMTMKEREVKHFLRRVIFCLPTRNYIAFEENPYFKDRRFASKYVSSFDVKSIESDVLNHFIASVAHICYGKILRHFLYRPELLHDKTAPWTQPDMHIDLENSSKHNSTKIPNRYDDEAYLILCSTDGLWIDVMKDESGDTKKRVTEDVTKLMQEAFQEFCRIFDNFSPVLGESTAVSDFVKEPLKVNVKTLTVGKNLE